MYSAHRTIFSNHSAHRAFYGNYSGIVLRDILGSIIVLFSPLSAFIQLKSCDTSSNQAIEYEEMLSLPIAPSSGFDTIEDPYACLLFFRGGFSSKLAELPLEGSYDASAAFLSSMFGPTPFFCSECDG